MCSATRASTGEPWLKRTPGGASPASTKAAEIRGESVAGGGTVCFDADLPARSAGISWFRGANTCTQGQYISACSDSYDDKRPQAASHARVGVPLNPACVTQNSTAPSERTDVSNCKRPRNEQFANDCPNRGCGRSEQAATRATGSAGDGKRRANGRRKRQARAVFGIDANGAGVS